MKADNVYLKPGEILTSEKPTIVTTVLGSCVAVTMFGERLGVGAICHAMLPMNPTSSGENAFRYVDSAILYMIGELGAAGVEKDEIEVKLMGGADVLERAGNTSASVGQQNVRVAIDIIRKEGLRLAACDVGGDVGRKIIFSTHTGGVLLKRISKKATGSIVACPVVREYEILTPATGATAHGTKKKPRGK